MSLSNSLADLAAVEGALAEYRAAISGKPILSNDLTVFTDRQFALQTLLYPGDNS